MPAISGLYKLITEDPIMIAGLGSYDNGGSAPVPSVYVGAVIPPDMELPAIKLDTIDSNRNGTDRGHRGGEVSIDIVLWGDKIPSDKALRELSEALFLLVNRATLESTATFELSKCVCSIPTRRVDPEGFPGYVTNAIILVRET